jgi:hypothetical protein
MTKRSTLVLGLAIVLLFAVFATTLYVTDALVVTGSEPNAKIVTGTLALIGGFIASVVSLLGVTLKYSIDRRTEERLALEAERNAIAWSEAEARLKLEASIRALELFGPENNQAIQRSGALFALQSLGQHTLALSLTSELLRGRQIDAGAAAHVVDAALRGDDIESQYRAIEAFVANADMFLTPQGYEIPSSLIGGDVQHSVYVREWAHTGVLRMLLARSLVDWKMRCLPAALGLVGALVRLWQIETEASIKADLAAELNAVLAALPEARITVNGMPMDEIRNAVATAKAYSEDTTELVGEIRSWSSAA